MKAKKFGKIVLRMIAIVLLSATIGTLLCYFSYLVPINSEIEDLAFETLDFQGYSCDYPEICNYGIYWWSGSPGIADMNTVHIIIKNTFSRWSGGFSELTKVAMHEEYSRYWHGYVSILRPLFYFMTYRNFEIVGGFLVIISVALCTAEISKRKSTPYAFAYLSSVIIIMPGIVGICLQYIWVFLIAHFGLYIALRNDRKLCNALYFMPFYTIVGAVTVYMDFLTYPLYTWGVIELWVLMCVLNDDTKETVTHVIGSAIAWGFGYIGMWASKWMIGSALLGKNVLAEARYQLRYRSFLGNGEWMIRSALFQNFKYYKYGPFYFLMVSWFAFFLVNILIKLFKGKRIVFKKKTIAVMLLGLSSLAWYFVAAEHTYIHHLFTYRIGSILVSACFSLIVLFCFPDEGRDEKNECRLTRKYFLSLLLILVLSFVLTIGLVYVTYDELVVKNTETPGFEDRYVEAGTSVSFDFIPSFGRITEYGL
ncbi:MAG: hypothetical protein K6G57_06100, partial [Lachnospiraceae bacterium]|nr:hypothetical protein [Lachnospiraceae bacterium]